jgi:hypothetical protein
MSIQRFDLEGKSSVVDSPYGMFVIYADHSAECDRRHRQATDFYKTAMDSCLQDGLVALAGVVCTPERGYIQDGGFNQFIADVKELRRLYLDLKKVRKWGYRSCRMPEFKTVKQPPGTSLCGAAVCAMAIGITLDEVLAETDWRHLSYTSGLVRYLASYGISMGWYLMGDGTKYKPWGMGTHTFVLEATGKGRPAIVAVKSSVYEEADHWVFWDGNELRDPSKDQDEYEVLEVHWLNYWPNPPPESELPTSHVHNYKPISSVQQSIATDTEPATSAAE